MNEEAQKTDRMIGKDSPEHPDYKEQEERDQGAVQSEQASEKVPAQGDRDVFIETEDKEVNEFASKTDRMISPEEAEKLKYPDRQESEENEKSSGPSKGGMTADDIFKKMSKDRSQERDRDL